MSLANSAGIHLGQARPPRSHPPGHRALWRRSRSQAARPNRCSPVVTAEARVLHGPPGQGRPARELWRSPHRLSRDSRIAVCGVGYADGFHRSASGAGVALRSAPPDGARGAFGAFDGERVPVIGKITMDLTMFDI
jgi:alanine racemase